MADAAGVPGSVELTETGVLVKTVGSDPVEYTYKSIKQWKTSRVDEDGNGCLHLYLKKENDPILVLMPHADAKAAKRALRQQLEQLGAKQRNKSATAIEGGQHIRSPATNKGRRRRRLSITRGSSTSSKPTLGMDQLASGGDRMYKAKLGGKNVQLNVTGMGLQVFHKRNRPPTTHLYHNLSSWVRLDDKNGFAVEPCHEDRIFCRPTMFVHKIGHPMPVNSTTHLQKKRN